MFVICTHPEVCFSVFFRRAVSFKKHSDETVSTVAKKSLTNGQYSENRQPLQLSSMCFLDFPSIHTYARAFQELPGFEPKFDLVLGINPLAAPSTVQYLRQHAQKTEAAPSGGVLDLKQAIVDTYEDQGLLINAEQVFIGHGTRILLDHLLRLLTGDVMIVEPAWPDYKHLTVNAGKAFFAVRPMQGYLPNQLDFHRAYVNSKKMAKILILNNPNNPTGVIYSKCQLEEIVDFCRQNRITVISDECQLVYLNSAYTNIAELYPEGTIIVSNGPSKVLGVGGYSISWSIVPDTYSGRQLLHGLKMTVLSNPAAPVQYAIAHSLCDSNVKKFAEDAAWFHQVRTQVFYEQLIAIGLTGPRPLATFNVLVSFQPCVEKLRRVGIKDDVGLQRYLLNKLRIGSVPGNLFGINPQDYCLRLSTSRLDQKAFDYWQHSVKADSEINPLTHPEMFKVIDKLRVFVNGSMC